MSVPGLPRSSGVRNHCFAMWSVITASPFSARAGRDSAERTSPAPERPSAGGGTCSAGISDLRCVAAHPAALSELLEVADEHAVELVRAADRLLRNHQIGRGEQQRPSLPPAEAAVAADQSLERGDLPAVLVDGAVDVQI